MSVQQKLSVLFVIFLILLILFVVVLVLVIVLIVFVVLVLLIVSVVVHCVHLLMSAVSNLLVQVAHSEYSLSHLRKTIRRFKTYLKGKIMLLVKNGNLYTMENEEPINADLFVSNGKIAEIGKNIEVSDDVKIIDAAGMNVFPGFIDAHSHLGICEEKATAQIDESNENTNPVMPAVRAIDGVNPMDSAFHNALASGITGVMVGPGSANPIGGQFAFIKTHGRCIDDMVVLAPAAIKIAFGENPMTNYGLNGNTPSCRMGTASLIREELFRAKQYFENENNQEKDFLLECYRDLFEGKIPLKAHVHRADDILTAIRIAKEFGLGLTLDHCTEGHLIAEKIAESGFPAIIGPSLASRNKKEVSQSDFKTAGILKKTGVRVAITTDHPVSRIQYLPLCAALAAKEGLGEYDALKAITIDAAKICRVDHRLGSLKVGKDADFVIFEGHPFDIFSRVFVTVIDGKIVWQ